MQFHTSDFTYSKIFWDICFLMKFFMSFSSPKQTLCFGLFSHGFLQYFCIWKQNFKAKTDKNCIFLVTLCKNNQMFCNSLQTVCIGFVAFCKNRCELCKNFEMVWFSQITQSFCTIAQNIWEIMQKSSDNFKTFCKFIQFAKIFHQNANQM